MVDYAPEVRRRYGMDAPRQPKELPPLVTDFHQNIRVTATGAPAESEGEGESDSEEEVKEGSPPPSPPPPPSPSFGARLLLYGCFVVWSLLFYGALSVALAHNVSLVDAALHLAHVRALPAPVFPMWNALHLTSAAPLDLSSHAARPLLATLAPSFAHHLRAFSCVCMHHLRWEGEVFRVCATANQRSIVNPRLVGFSNETRTLLQVSQACERGSVVRRRQSVFVAWDAPEGEMYAAFGGDEAACLQMALDEMDGKNEHCS